MFPEIVYRCPVENCKNTSAKLGVSEIRLPASIIHESMHRLRYSLNIQHATVPVLSPSSIYDFASLINDVYHIYVYERHYIVILTV